MEKLHVFVESNPDDKDKPLELVLYSKHGDLVFKNSIKTNLYKFGHPNSYDIIVKYNSKSYKLHCLILLQSSYFAEILPLEEVTINLAELERKGISEYDRKISIPEFDITDRLRSDIDPSLSNEMLELVFKYLYTGDLRIPKDELVVNYFQIFKSLKIHEVASALRSYMGTFLTPLDACSIVDIAFKRGHTELYRTCLKLIGLHAETIFASDAILSFSFQLLKDCVSCDIEIEEQNLYLGVKKWIDHHAENEVKNINDVQIAHERKIQFITSKWKEIEEYIRWPLMHSDFLFEFVEPLNIISSYLLDEAYQHIALQNSKWDGYQGRGIRTKTRGGIRWVWSDDPDKHHSSIKVSNRGTVIRKVSQSSHASVLGTRGFKSGKHVWKLKVNSPSHWIATGLCFKSQLTRDLTNDYSYMYGASSQNQLYQMTGNLTGWNQNDIITCTLKITGSTAYFNIKSSSGTDISATIPMSNEELVPISNLYSLGNELILMRG